MRSLMCVSISWKLGSERISTFSWFLRVTTML